MANGAVYALVLALGLCLLQPILAQSQEFVDRHNYWRARVNPPAGTSFSVGPTLQVPHIPSTEIFLHPPRRTQSCSLPSTTIFSVIVRLRLICSLTSILLHDLRYLALPSTHARVSSRHADAHMEHCRRLRGDELRSAVHLCAQC